MTTNNLLWYADEKPENSVEHALVRFRQKFGCAPTTLFVHPTDTLESDTLRVVKDDKVQRGYRWLELPEGEENGST